MAAFNVDITYTIISTEIASDQIAVTFTLACTAANLTTEYTEVYPLAMYFQNIDDQMDENDLQVQVRANFQVLAKPTLEDFARIAKATIQEDQGVIGTEDLTGVVTLSEVITLSAGDELNSIIATWE
jgi:hypothetical protein